MSEAELQPWPDETGGSSSGKGGAGATQPDDDSYAGLYRAQRRLQDLLTGAALPDAVATEVTAQLIELGDLCAAHQVREHRRHDGVRADLPGRGHPLLPPYVIDTAEPGTLRGRVTFGRFHLGGNGVVHGGVQPLLFDDVSTLR